MKSGFSRLAVWLALFCCNCFVFAEFSRADLITAQLEGNSGFSGNNYPGQSVFFTGTQSYDNLLFNWFSTIPGGPPNTAVGGAFATGTLVLLSQSYAGTPNNLDNTTPGFIASANASGGNYVFASNVTVAPNTFYFFYQKDPAIGFIMNSNSTYVGEGFRASGATTNFIANVDMAFRFQGTAVPEPSLIILLTISAGSLVFRRRSRNCG